jgi:hypothetical protein
MTRVHRGVGVAAADFSTSIHRFVIVALRGGALAPRRLAIFAKWPEQFMD